MNPLPHAYWIIELELAQQRRDAERRRLARPARRHRRGRVHRLLGGLWR